MKICYDAIGLHSSARGSDGYRESAPKPVNVSALTKYPAFVSENQVQGVRTGGSSAKAGTTVHACLVPNAVLEKHQDQTALASICHTVAVRCSGSYIRRSSFPLAKLSDVLCNPPRGS